MKKVLFKALTLALPFTLMACGEMNNHAATPNAGNEQADTSEDSSHEPSTKPDQSSNDAVDTTADPSNEPVKNETLDSNRIKLTIDNEEYIVTMYDNPTSRDFWERLPLTLTFEDFGGFEKMSILEEGLSIEDAPEGSTPSAGDFAYFAPWKDVTIFYKGYRYSPGLIQLGKIESDVEELAKKLERMNDEFSVKIEEVES